MALVTICVTAIGTLIIERVARKIYSEIRSQNRRPKKWVCIWKISGQYSLCVWNETQIF